MRKAASSSAEKPAISVAKKFTPKAKAVVSEVGHPVVLVHANGSYEFLINSFAKPVTIVDAAVLLAEHGKYPGDVAVKKVEAFLENAKIDRALEVRAGTGSNAGQYVIVRVPKAAQRKTGAVVKKTMVNVKKSGGDVTKSRGLIAAMLALLSEKPMTRESVVAVLAKEFPDRTLEQITNRFRANFGGANPFQQKERGNKVIVSKKDGDIYYHVTFAKG